MRTENEEEEEKKGGNEGLGDANRSRPPSSSLEVICPTTTTMTMMVHQKKEPQNKTGSKCKIFQEFGRGIINFSSGALVSSRVIINCCSVSPGARRRTTNFLPKTLGSRRCSLMNQTDDDFDTPEKSS